MGVDKEHGRIVMSRLSKKIKKETLSEYSNGKIKCATCDITKI